MTALLAYLFAVLISGAFGVLYGMVLAWSLDYALERDRGRRDR